MSDTWITVVGAVLVAGLAALGTMYVGRRSGKAAEMTAERQTQLDMLAMMQAQIVQQDARIQALTTRLAATEDALQAERRARWELEAQLRQGSPGTV